MASSAHFVRQALNNTFLLPTALGSAAHVIYSSPSSSCDNSSALKLKGLKHGRGKQSEGHIKGVNNSISVNLKTRMTSIGRFSLQSESISHPSIPTFFIALSGPTKSQSIWNQSNSPVHGHTNISKDDLTSMSVSEFIQLWERKNIAARHPRFHSKLQPSADELELTTPNLQNHISETLPYFIPRLELQGRIEQFLCNKQKLPLYERLWEAQITNGPLGSSGAISKKKAQMLSDGGENDRETVILFRSHHCMADGVSLAAALMDLSDESEQFQLQIRNAMEKRKGKGKRKGGLRKLIRLLKRLLWFWIGSVKAMSYQGYIFLISCINEHPFQFILDQYLDSSSSSNPGRSVSWCDAALLSEARHVVKTLFPKATLNDLFATCVAGAIRRQIACHASVLDKDSSKSREQLPSPQTPPKYVNFVMPVHLMGGVLPPGYSLSNKIGAIGARIPTSGGPESLQETSQTLAHIKQTPTGILSHFFAKFIATFIPSKAVASSLFTKVNSTATFTLSNVRGPSNSIHWNGREVISMGGFVPLPPGLYVGVAVQTYNGVVSLTVNADKRIIPDADLFLKWVQEEYSLLCREAEKKLKSTANM